MKPYVRPILLAFAPLTVISLIMTFGVYRVLQGWFVDDASTLSSGLVLGNEADLAAAALGDGAKAGVLDRIAGEPGVLAVGLCARDGTLMAATDRSLVACAPIAARFDAVKAYSHEPAALAGRSVLVTAIPIGRGSRDLAVIVRDMESAHRRTGSVVLFALVAFAFFATVAAAATAIITRMSWRMWTQKMLDSVRGEAPQEPRFVPLLRDVRRLISELAVEEQGSDAITWNPGRLRRLLMQDLHGERILVAANREPYIHARRENGEIEVLHPASGLVTALEPIMRACSGVWIGHGSGSADREVVDEHDRVMVPPGEESYALRRVWLSKEEEQGYYYGFANEALWPLCHLAHTRPQFRGEDWRYYQHVNRLFADAIVSEARVPDPVVMVQDYHFALLPRLVRERLPAATIITFWHIPWPNSERFGVCPWRKDIIEGLLGSSIMGFHTPSHCNNFFDAVDAYLEARIDRDQRAVVFKDQVSLVRSYPISVDMPNHWAERTPAPPQCRKQVFEELGLPENMMLGVGVDRLDYTKGIEERLGAVERLFEQFPEFIGRFTFVQLAAPSRTAIGPYQELAGRVRVIVERVNARFGRDGFRPIVYFEEHHEPPRVFTYFKAADVCYVSSLHDGMNLVAKEFVTARDDEAGVLMLSCFTGAARELTEALIVNPYDLDEAAAAMSAALHMSPEEQAERMRSMRAYVSHFNIYRWAGAMLVDAGRVRHRERLAERLEESAFGVPA
ncbi:trehalose-6-phosphate synthase [bacterium]|nr:trehalose-6-phosphate synthase [bacterium]